MVGSWTRGRAFADSALGSFNQDRTPFKAFLPPDLVSNIVFRDDQDIFWQPDPGLFCGRENMNIRRCSAGIIQRAGANESNEFTDATVHDKVVAPDRYLALRTACDLLVSAAGGGDSDLVYLALEKFNPVCLYQYIYGKCRTVLALTPGAVTTVNHQRL